MTAAEELRTIENDINICYARLQETSEQKPVRSHGLFFYFRPFFIASFATYFLVLSGTSLLHAMSITGNIDASYSPTAGFSIILPAVCFGLIHIIGGIVARKIRDKKAYEANSIANERIQTVERLKKEIVDLKVKKSMLQKRMKDNESSGCFEKGNVISGNVSINTGSGNTIEDAVRLADYLADKYDSIEKLESDISNCERHILSHQSRFAQERYSAFRFFLPFFIASLILAGISVLYMAVQIIISDGDEFGRTIERITPFVPFIIIMIIHVIGGVYARNKRDKLNAAMDEYEAGREKECEEFQRKCIDLKSRLKTVQEEAAAYNEIIPAFLRKRVGMVRVRKIIESGRAGTIEEAVSILSASNGTVM